MMRHGQDFRATLKPPRNARVFNVAVSPRGSAKVAVSLRRDEPCSATLAAFWPVNISNAFTHSELHVR
jgi:hypothetical protein